MEKTLDEKCELEIALAWAVGAKNAFQNHLGHSPNELMFGFDINTTSVSTEGVLHWKLQQTVTWCGPTKVLSKEGQCVLIRHGRAFYKIHSCHLVKTNKKFGSSRNEENKTAKNEINKVLREENEGQHNKSLHINRKELKDSKKSSRGKVVEYQLKWSDEWKTGKIMSA